MKAAELRELVKENKEWCAEKARLMNPTRAPSLNGSWSSSGNSYFARRRWKIRC
jgi:hypothetical protein